MRNSYSRAYTEYNDDELSRAMSKVLRHQGDRCGVAVNAEGYAAAEHGQPAAGCISDATLEALAGFLRLGLKHFWAWSTEPARELAIDAALVDLATTPGKTYSLGADAGDALAKLWACVAFEAPKTTKHSTSPLVGKQAKDQKKLHILGPHLPKAPRAYRRGRLCCLWCRARRARVGPVVAGRGRALRDTEH